MMRLASWNVNSIRARSESVVAWAVDADVDVVALQETKCTDDGFLSDELLAAGYDVAFTGSGGYNGSPSPRASASTRWSTDSRTTRVRR